MNTQLTPAKFFIRFYIHIRPATAFLLDLVPIQNGMKSLLFFHSTTHSIDNGIVESTKRERCTFQCLNTMALYQIPRHLPNLQPLHHKCQLDLLASFVNHVRQGSISKRQQTVCDQTVSVILRSISTQLQLDGEQNPTVDAEEKHPITFSQILEGFGREDPPSQPKLAIPLAVSIF